MQLHPGFRSVLTAAIIAAATGYAQTIPDQNDPTRQSTITPTLLNMGSGFDYGNTGPFVTMTDRQFLERMTLRGLMEVELSRIAAEKAETPAVRQLALRMTDEYTRWSATAGRVSGRLGLRVPSELDSKRKAAVAKIAALSGPEFERAYLNEMVRLQNRALTMTHLELTNSGIGGLKNWAGKLEPLIQEQLAQAKKNLAETAVVSKK